jgi:rubrerythrin
MTVSNSWSEWWRRFLGLASNGYERAVEILRQRYIEESQHVARFSRHAEKMQYPQFRDALLRIAADETKHLDWIAEKLRLLGSRPPDVPEIVTTEKNSWQYLLEDLGEEQECASELLEQARSVRDEMPTVAELLERIYEDGKNHRAEIREMLMKSDPQSLWPA